MKKDFAVNYDSRDGFDYDECFQTLREAMHFYNNLSDSVPYKNLTYDDDRRGTLTLLTSNGENNLRKYGFLPCDYN